MAQKKQRNSQIVSRVITYTFLFLGGGLGGWLIGSLLPVRSSVAGIPTMSPLITTQSGELLAQVAPDLEEALELQQNPNPCQATEGRFKQVVIALAADKKQALVGYSCGSSGLVRLVMFKQDATWKLIGSADGKFKGDIAGDYDAAADTLSCSMVGSYSIERSIAPVCHDAKVDTSDLAIGATNAYTYRVR